jgi:hypothetical protein
MITGFEQQTGNLTQRELDVLPDIIEQLNKTSKDRPLKNRAINGNLLFRSKGNFEGVRIRKIINHISLYHMTRLPLVANSRGYYITSDDNEIRRYVQSLTDRISSIANRQQSVKKWRISNG